MKFVIVVEEVDKLMAVFTLMPVTDYPIDCVMCNPEGKIMEGM